MILDDDISPRYLYRYPDISDSNIKSIYLGTMIIGKVGNIKNAKSMGFKSRAKGPSGNYLDYDNIDEKLCEINIWLKYMFGFWRATDQVCYDIWNNKL